MFSLKRIVYMQLNVKNILIGVVCLVMINGLVVSLSLSPDDGQVPRPRATAATTATNSPPAKTVPARSS